MTPKPTPVIRYPQQIGVHLTDEQYRSVCVIAARLGRTPSEHARAVLDQHIQMQLFGQVSPEARLILEAVIAGRLDTMTLFSAAAHEQEIDFEKLPKESERIAFDYTEGYLRRITERKED